MTSALAEKADQRIMGVTKSRNAGSSGPIKAGSHVRRKDKNGGPQLSRQKQFSLVFSLFLFAILRFAEEFQNNIDRDQKKPVGTIFIRNSEMKLAVILRLTHLSRVAL